MAKPTAPEPVPSMSDLNRAQMMVSQNRQTIRYNHVMRSWYIWNKKIWKQDKNGQIFQIAKQTINSLYRYILPNIDPDKKRKFMGQLLKAESQHGLKTMIESAENEPGMPIETSSFDAYPDFLNVHNGTIDLATGELLNHKREMYLTKMISFDYDKNATCPNWMNFIETTFQSDKEVIEFIQRFFGYSLTGRTSEQVFLIFYGHGSNGKGVLLDTVSNVMEIFATTTTPETIMKKRNERASTNDLADLWGARFVTTSETDSYQELDEGRIKRITGQDKIKCRFLYQEWFEYLPEYSLVLMTNHEPVIKSHDHSIWRRVLKINFNHKMDEAKKNLKLREELMEEKEGILKWMIDGAVKWYDDGLKIPESVRQSTTEYKRELDVIGDFIEMCLVTGADVKITNTELYKCYEWWCGKTINKVFAPNTFSKSILERGFNNKKIKNIKFKVGLDVKGEIKSLIDLENTGGATETTFAEFEMAAAAGENSKTPAGTVGTGSENGKHYRGTAGTPKTTHMQSSTWGGIYNTSPDECRTRTLPYPDNECNTANSEKDDALYILNDVEPGENGVKRVEIDTKSLVKLVISYKERFHSGGKISNVEQFALLIKNQNKELANVDVEYIADHVKKLSRNGWK